MSEEEIRKTYKCGHLCDYSPKDKMCRAIEKIIELQKEIELKDKVIDKMAEELKSWDINDKNYNHSSNKEEIKQYFINKVKGE